MPSSDGLEVADLTVAWRGRAVVERVSFSVGRSEFVTLMGPNGSGKTTILRALAGFEPTTAGRLELRGRDLTTLPPHRRRVSLLFQEPVLLPRRSVWENIAFGPEVQGLARGDVEQRVEEALALLRIRGLADRRSEALSGGERQRVALARTIAARPDLILLDEPLASVDPGVRSELRAELRGVLARDGASVIYVTHDRDEGLSLGDRVLLLLEGRLAQSGPPEEVLRRPRSVGVARFLGYNVVRVGERRVAVHPTAVELVTAGGGRTDASVISAGLVGDGWVAYLESEEGQRWEVRGRSGEPPRSGARVGLSWPPSSVEVG